MNLTGIQLIIFPNLVSINIYFNPLFLVFFSILYHIKTTLSYLWPDCVLPLLLLPLLLYIKTKPKISETIVSDRCPIESVVPCFRSQLGTFDIQLGKIIIVYLSYSDFNIMNLFCGIVLISFFTVQLFIKLSSSFVC